MMWALAVSGFESEPGEWRPRAATVVPQAALSPVASTDFRVRMATGVELVKPQSAFKTGTNRRVLTLEVTEAGERIFWTKSGSRKLGVSMSRKLDESCVRVRPPLSGAAIPLLLCVNVL